MIVVSSDRSVQTLLLPLNDVFEGSWFVPDSVCNKAVFVSEGPDMFVVYISSWEA